MAKIKAIQAREILDSRGIPTIESTTWLDTGHASVASIPSGTSTGKYEAKELRDGDPNRFAGMGVLKSVDMVNRTLAPKLVGLDVSDQAKIDQFLLNLDGTSDKSRYGANTLLSISQGVCEVAALASNLPLYKYLIAKYSLTKSASPLPTPIFNVVNGGKHGSGNLDFQEFHIIPAQSFDYHTALRCGEEIYQQLGAVLHSRNIISSVGAEGGYAPNLFTNRDAIDVIVEAIGETKYKLDRDVFLGLDVAASHFFKDGHYKIKDNSQDLSSDSLAELLKQWSDQYHFVSVEDPIHEDDWQGWTKITHELGKTTVVGDDLLATNKERLRKAIELKAASGILVKPNQVGTISETIEVIRIAQQAGWKVIVSHRSGETNDDFIADFAVGVGANFTKFGAPARGERVAKYNRLSKIESEVSQAPQV